MFCKLSVFKIIAKFTGKHLCENLVFNKVLDCRNLQNSRENTYTGVLFLINLQTRDTISTSNY